MSDLILINTTDIFYTAIVTEPWLDKTVGPVSDAWYEFLDRKNAEHKASFPATPEGERDWNWSGANPYTNRFWLCNDEMQAAIGEYLYAKTGEAWVPACDIDNVYNNEQDFTSVFQYQPWVPAREATWHEKTRSWACDEWYYKDEIALATEIHMGGDVRGNYGTVQLRIPDHSNYGGLAEGGFLEWKLGWHVTAYDAEEKRHDYIKDARGWDNDEFSEGCMPDPTYHLTERLTGKARWSDKRGCFIGWLDGRAVEMRPECRASY